MRCCTAFRVSSLALVALTCHAAFAQVPDTERAALVALYESTNGAEWTESSGWLGAPGTECTWYGVECWVEGHISSIELGSNNLVGELPAELGNLAELQNLSISWNQISGSIPDELGGLSRLEALDLVGNQLSGEIPSALGGLAALEYLNLNSNQLSGEIPSGLAGLGAVVEIILADNQLTGEIPPELGQLATLENLWLAGNQLEGSIPAEFGNLSSVRGLSLGSNQLTGDIPGELGNLDTLQWLAADDNQLEGEIPGELGGLANLLQLYLSANRLDGEIPGELGNLANLVDLQLYSNQLSGTIPSQLQNLAVLENLDLGDNRLTGTLPSWLTSLASLRSLWLGNNQLIGTLPPELGDAPALEELGLNGNSFSGEIPEELQNLENLSYLDLGTNQLTGDLPAWISNLTNLRYLSLGWNELTGTIPPAFGSLSNLEELILDANHFQGTIPPEIGSLAQLQGFAVGENQLSGTIPIEITDLTQMRWLYLASNLFTGTIPPGLGDLENMEDLFAGDNQLTGTIPPELGQLAQLGTLALEGNQLTGEIPESFGNLPALVYLNLVGNQLTGTIPPGLGSLEGLEGLWLGENQLTGTIPPELGNLTRVEWLYLGWNLLSGTIPPELGNMTALVTLDLWINQLSGPIPDELGDLENLRHMWLNGNQLSGTIPAQLGNLTSLEEIALDSNQLTGTIPPELGELTALRSLALDINRLSGTIPPELGNLTRLEQLWFPDNQLTGTIPPELGNLENLQALHMRSNALTGSVPDSLANLTNLWDGWGLDLRWNGLYTSNPELRDFLDSRQEEGEWENTQTIAPTDLTIGEVTAGSVQLSWTPIVYTWDPGSYRVLGSSSAGGPHQQLGSTTDKETATLTVEGLQPATTYHLVVHTVTDPHSANQNTVESADSDEVMAMTGSSTDCSLACSATAPSSAEVGETVSFAGSATSSNCTGDVGYAWTFGDSDSSQQQSPSHSYDSTGTYGWQMTASIENVSCSEHGNLVVFAAGSECGNGICEQGETAWTCDADCGFAADETGRAGESSQRSAVPAAVGGVGGVGDTYWVSEAMIHNPGGDPASFSLVFTPDAAPAQAVTAGPLTLAGGDASFYGNFVEELFGVNSNGSVRITSDQDLMFVSRTFNDLEDGTYGQFLGAVSTSRALGIGDVGYLVGLSEDDAFRSNVIIQEVAGETTDVEVSVYQGSGELEGTATITVTAGAKAQNRLLNLGFSDLSGGYATVEVTGGGQVVAIASVVDESTGDAMTVDALHPSQVQLTKNLPPGVENPAKVKQQLDFTWSPRYPLINEPVVFTETSSGEIRSWRWSFGDGATSSERNPTHTYTDAGTYRVTLAASSSVFGSTMRTKTLTVESAASSGAHYLVAVVARLPGAEDTVWRSDVWVMNPFATSQRVWLDYYPVDGAGAQRVPITVGSGAQEAIGDVIAGLFGTAGDGKGALHVWAPQGVIVSSRTYNLGDVGTFGQAIPALGGGDLLAVGETGRLLKLKSTANTRCNVGFTEFDGNDTSVRVRLYSLAGTSLSEIGNKTYSVSAYENLQINRIFSNMGITEDVEAALALVEVLSGGRVYAYASSVDSRTGDAEFIPAMKAE